MRKFYLFGYDEGLSFECPRRSRCPARAHGCPGCDALFATPPSIPSSTAPSPQVAAGEPEYAGAEDTRGVLRAGGNGGVGTAAAAAAGEDAGGAGAARGTDAGTGAGADASVTAGAGVGTAPASSSSAPSHTGGGESGR